MSVCSVVVLLVTGIISTLIVVSVVSDGDNGEDEGSKTSDGSRAITTRTLPGVLPLRAFLGGGGASFSSVANTHQSGVVAAGNYTVPPKETPAGL